MLHPRADTFFDDRHSRYVAEQIPNARYVETSGGGPAWFGDEEAQASADEIEHFLTGTRHAVVSDRILATVLFTDIVGSTQRAPALGDGAWQSLLAHHDNLVREEVERHRGRFVKSLGDGALAVFERPEPGDQIRMSMVRCGPPWQSLRRSDACDRRARRRCLAA